MSIQFTLETIDSIRYEIQPLLEEHYKEIALDQDVIHLDVDWDKYRMMEANHGLLLIGARDKGSLVGYSVFFLNNHAHYKEALMAVNDVLFVRSDYRKSSIGFRLIKKSEEILKELGVIKVVWHIKYSNDFRPLMYKLGYKDEEVCVGKILKD